jgi:hypothetical protein
MSKQYFTFQNTVAVPSLWHDLLVPSTFKDPATGRTGKTEYIVKVILDPASEDFKKLRTVFIESARSKWPNADNAFLNALVKPFKNGDAVNAAAKEKNKEGYDFLAGKVLYTAKSINPPTLSYLDNKGNLVDAENEQQRAQWKRLAYDGSEAYINTTLVPYQVGTSAPCVSAYVNNVLVLGRGPRLSGSPASSEVFSKYIGQTTDENPLAGQANDDIAF